MKQSQQLPYQIQINEESIQVHDSFPQIKNIQATKKVRQEPKFEQNNQQIFKNRFILPPVFKRQLLRVVLIPALIVLFLLTIALTFKQNNYQTNDYFYSKNIQINRKIRGIVPPLNQTKQNIFGEYEIGLVQSFTIQNRRIFENFKVEIWKNQSMRISQIGKEAKCWSLYKLKFYSSTIFIEKLQSYENIYTEGDFSKIARQNIKTQNDQSESKGQSFSFKGQQDKSSTTQKNGFDNTSQNSTDSKKSSNSLSSQLRTASICQDEKWLRLDQILGNSHIWTFAEDNFYLMEFSQNGNYGNGVLIMKILKQQLQNV